MRKNDPRYEITPEVRSILMTAVLSAEPEKNIADLQVESFDEQEVDVLSKEVLDGLINDIAKLIPDYYKAIDRGNAHKLQEVLDKGFPVNYFNPVSGGTALHRLAAGGARPAIRALLTYENIDFLARDNQGRLSSEMAYLYGHDPALARLLGKKERKQAEAQGIKLTRRPPPEPQP